MNEKNIIIGQSLNGMHRRSFVRKLLAKKSGPDPEGEIARAW